MLLLWISRHYILLNRLWNSFSWNQSKFYWQYSLDFYKHLSLRRELHPRPPAYKASAIATMLRRQFFWQKIAEKSGKVQIQAINPCLREGWRFIKLLSRKPGWTFPIQSESSTLLAQNKALCAQWASWFPGIPWPDSAVRMHPLANDACVFPGLSI